MIVTEIKKIGKGKKYYLYVDEKLVGIFADIILAESGLKTGCEISEEFLKDLKERNGSVLAFDMAISYISKIAKSEKGIKRYLKQKGIDAESIDSAILKLKEYGYINDRAYAENFALTHFNKSGKSVLKLKLKNEGISSEIISEVLDGYSDDEELEKCKTIYFKYTKNLEKTPKNKQKTLNYLFSKGFSFDICKKVVNAFWENEDDWV